MLDRALIDHASPTLAHLKLGSLFTFRIDGDFYQEFAMLRDQLNEKGVTLTLLRVREGIALIYLYREKELNFALNDDAIWTFLMSCGYERRETAPVLRRLRERIKSSRDFPHEIGVFLGYPLADVIGFIDNQGRDCLACGAWKVYSNACEALRAFERYRKCKAVYQKLFASGCPLSRLTVAARGA